MWYIPAFISALFSGLAAVFEKKALFKMDALAFSFLLSALTFILTLPFLFVVDFASLSVDAVIILFIKSVLGAIAFLLVMYGIQKNDISNSLPLLVLTPGVVAVLAYFLLDEEIGLQGIAGMVVLLAGTYLLQLDKGRNWLSPFFFLKRNRSLWYIVGAILLFATTTILDKTILKSYKLAPEAFLPIQQFYFTFIFFLVICLRKAKEKELKVSFGKQWKLLLLVAVFAVIYRYSHILALKAGPVALVLSVKRTSVFFAALIGGHYFKEQNLFRRSIAVVLMIAGAILLIMS